MVPCHLGAQAGVCSQTGTTMSTSKSDDGEYNSRFFIDVFDLVLLASSCQKSLYATLISTCSLVMMNPGLMDTWTAKNKCSVQIMLFSLSSLWSENKCY